MTSRRRPQQLAALLAAFASASDVAITAAFQPPSRPNSNIYQPIRRHHPFTQSSNNVRPLIPSSSSSQAGSTTSLHMVMDFFKKAQTEASEQMSAFSAGLAKSRNQFLYNLEDSLNGGGNLLDQLEDTLLQADLGMATTDDVLSEARFLREESTEIFGQDDIKALLRGKLLEALGASAGGSSQYERVRVRAGKDLKGSNSDDDDNNVEDDGDGRSTERPSFTLKFAGEDDDKPISASRPLTVHFIMGANGMGKTTTIGKLAHRLKTEADQKVLLAACDTFRAGAVAQLEQWADRADVDCFSPNEATNGPSAVLYGALDKAIAEGYDALLVDTSGRLSNNDALTAELVKMKRVIQKRMSTKFDENVKPMPNLDVPHETLLVIDAAQGRMALDSAKQWDKELGLSGLILTKLDGSAKGGSVVAVSRELGLPVKLVGVGEGMEDLRDFEPESFVDGLLGIGIAGGGKSKDEGKALASRLTQMRKERNERAKTATATKKEDKVSPSGPAGQMTLQGLGDMDSIGDFDADMGEMEVITPGGGGTNKSSKGKTKNKKKKKKKKGKR
eukprot:CAMPEP_0181100368 /NCGR_PEP_ID=MMETSP1071-20121207/13156_1 /TAXON_ID=35127 /ORGANISM="Thalassiosira sp., Strain NH16" /LENGTH=559 /DNA_ID=CAMNT_0023183093 /DNA_START=189 /DNA_END=1868 /DNA_ORIENTATION=+